MYVGHCRPGAGTGPECWGQQRKPTCSAGPSGWGSGGWGPGLAHRSQRGPAGREGMAGTGQQSARCCTCAQGLARGWRVEARVRRLWQLQEMRTEVRKMGKFKKSKGTTWWS